jgi:HD superfamily phosphohydrolase
MHTEEKSSKPRIILRVIKPISGKYKRDIISETIELMRRRYSLAEKVYFHHAKTSASAMIISATLSAMSNNKDIIEEKFYGLGDNDFLSLVKTDPIGNKILTRLERRELYKPVYKSVLSTPDTVDPTEMGPVEKIKKLVENLKENHYHFERNLEKQSLLEPGDVIIYCPEPEMNQKTAETLVSWRGKIIQLQHIGVDENRKDIESIVNHHRYLWSIYVFMNPELVKDKNREENYWVAWDAEQHIELTNALDEFRRPYVIPWKERFLQKAMKEPDLKSHLKEYIKVTTLAEEAFRKLGTDPDLNIPDYREFITKLKETIE